MSSVLEALKKAERDRRDSVSPSVLTPNSHQSKPSRRNGKDIKPVLWLLFLLANVAAATWLLLNVAGSQNEVLVAQPVQQPIAEGSEVTNNAEAYPEPIVSPPEQALEMGAVVAKEGETNAPMLLATEFVLPKAPGELVAPQVQIAEEPEATPVLVDEVAEPDSQSVAIERYQGSDFRSSKLGAHIFSDIPDRRLVMLNGKAYRENNTLDNGWVLLEIGREELTISDGAGRYSLPLAELR